MAFAGNSDNTASRDNSNLGSTTTCSSGELDDLHKSSTMSDAPAESEKVLAAIVCSSTADAAGDVSSIEKPLSAASDGSSMEKPSSSCLTLQPNALPAGIGTFGWAPRPELTDDENGMDLVLLLARNSLCRGGSMGCALVRADGAIISCGVNGAYGGVSDGKRPDSQVHAEVNAIGHCARRGVATDGVTAYITMPPCKKCFAVLTASGVSRVVSRKRVCDQDAKEILPAAKDVGMEFVVVPDTAERRAVLDSLVADRTRNSDASDDVKRRRTDKASV